MGPSPRLIAARHHPTPRKFTVGWCRALRSIAKAHRSPRHSGGPSPRLIAARRHPTPRKFTVGWCRALRSIAKAHRSPRHSGGPSPRLIAARHHPTPRKFTVGWCRALRSIAKAPPIASALRWAIAAINRGSAPPYSSKKEPRRSRSTSVRSGRPRLCERDGDARRQIEPSGSLALRYSGPGRSAGRTPRTS